MLKQQRERIEVDQLFKQLIQIVNSHTYKQNNENVQIMKSLPMSKVPSIGKKKSKYSRSVKQGKDTEGGKQQILDIIQIKNGKKPSMKLQKKQQAREEQTKIKKFIFNDYSQIMTYKIHKQEKPQNKISDNVNPLPNVNVEGQQKQKKSFSIRQNLTITINPNAKQPIMNQFQ